MAKKFLQQVLSLHFIKFSLIPIFVVEVALLILYFSINAYISSKNTTLMLDEVQVHAKEVLKNEAKVIDDRLNEVSMMAKFLQKENEALFKNPSGFGLPNGEPSFAVAKNGVFYKTNKVGSSLYYSSETKIDEKAKNKAIFTEAMDNSFKSMVEINPIIVAAYFNSWDNMNRLYPFIDKVYEQYGNHIQMEDYNFYYLADLKHNPEKKPVWTGAYLDPAGNGWMLSCIVPIYKDDFLEGVTGLDITVDSFVKNILNIKMAYNAKLFLVDGNGMIIAMPEEIEKLLGLKELKEHLYTDKILKTIEKPEEFNILKNNSPFASHFKKLMEDNLSSDFLKIGNEEYLTLQQSVEQTDWKLMVLIDKKEIFDSINSLKEFSNKIGYMAIIFLLLFYAIFFFLLIRKINKFSEVITEPIIKLSNQTSEIKSTDIEIEPINTDIKEISQLNHNFINMMEELHDSTKKLYEAKDEAERLAKTKDEFLANMSHELKTPLNSINVISELMKGNSSGNLDERQIKSLGIINKCGKDLLLLINDVLDLSKLEAGQIELDYTNIDIKELGNSIYEMFHVQALERKIDFVYEADESLDLISSDEGRVKQVIKNFLSNALKFTDPNKKVKFSIKDEDKNIRVIVEDEGIGISADKLEHIFDRFKQADASTTRKYGGTGLGLAICKDLITILGGEIEVSSVEGKGSRFEAIFPKNTKNIERSCPLNIKKERTKNDGGKKRVLLHNSDPIGFLTIAQEIKKHFEFKLTSNLNEIIQEYKNRKSFVIIDQDRLKEQELKLIKEAILDEDLIILYENSVNEEFEKVHKKIKKPLKLDDILN